MVIPPILDPLFGWLTKWGTLLGTFVSVFLYYMLVKVNRGQEKLLKAELSPSIEVSDTDINNNTVTLKITNHGGGLAKNLRLRTCVLYPEEKKQDEVEAALQKYVVGTSLRHRAIAGNKSNEEFKGVPAFDPNRNSYETFHKQVENILSKKDITKFRYRVFLVYENLTDETKKTEVFRTREFSRDMFGTPIQGDLTFERLYSRCVKEVSPEVPYKRGLLGKLKLWLLGK